MERASSPVRVVYTVRSAWKENCSGTSRMVRRRCRAQSIARRKISVVLPVPVRPKIRRNIRPSLLVFEKNFFFPQK